LAHVFGFHRINPALLYDVSNCYYHSPWGATGLLTRYPALVPRPSYVALATLTEVLDCAKAVRSLATGSRSLYAIEFETSHGRTYALWTPRGVREATLQFAQDTEFTRIDLWGRRKRVKTKGAAADLAVSTAPAFLRIACRTGSTRSAAWTGRNNGRLPASRTPDWNVHAGITPLL
jgi:hypothetical protein